MVSSKIETHLDNSAGRVSDPADQVSSDPCPAPMSWQQVVQAFRAESIRWQLNRGRYVLSGRSWGQGPPLYFLNGLGGTHELYALSVWQLRKNFRCVVYDSPGSEPGSIPRGRLSVSDLADDLFAVADLHGDERIAVFATSFGVMVALGAMLASPGRIERCVLQGGFAYRRLSLFERALTRMCRYLPGTFKNVPGRRWLQTQSHRRWFPPFDRTRWEFFLENTGRVPIAALAQRAAVLLAEDLRPRLPEIEPPVLLIRSEGEGLVSAECHRELASGLNDPQVEWFHSCGHLPYLTHPHRVAKVVESFLLPCRELEVETCR